MVYKCNVCEFSTDSLEEMEEHMSEHAEKIEKDENGRYKCKCGYDTGEKYKMKHHMMSHTREE